MGKVSIHDNPIFEISLLLAVLFAMPMPYNFLPTHALWKQATQKLRLQSPTSL
jgi:hypothetical protein